MIELTELYRIQRAAEALLLPLANGPAAEIMKALAPQPGDYDRVFVGKAVDLAREGYRAMWNAPPKAFAKPGQTEVRAFACDAESLQTENEFSQNFPGGYRRVAAMFKPDLVWVAFKFVVPGQSLGMAYDGLVYLGDRWAWFPKPWRYLEQRPGDVN